MKLNKLLQIAFALMMLFVISCNDDSDELAIPKGAYENGIFIANEGNFNTPNAEISFVTNDLASFENNIFSKNNGGAPLGDVLQNVAINGDYVYMVLNNSNKIVVADRYNMKKYGEITTEINQPRYIAFSNNRIYVTNDEYNGDKYVSVYNLSDFSFVTKLDFASANACERIVSAGGNIFVQHASYGFGNSISYIDASTNTLSSTITLPYGQIGKTISENNIVYAIAGDASNSYIYEISPNGNIINTTTLTGIANATNLELENGTFYFSSGESVYSMAQNSPTVPTTPLFTVANNPYSSLYGFNVIGDRIFTADANGFTADSKISVYSTSGSLLKEFNAGRGTNGFYLNN